ncbi:hypothetical protein R3P38DRAFT_3479514 [Favolaschia claudopus]|uniref:Uncharacterized protein n=1 Tax=Favolaschia claudopus TaxID=2862362 RepID=A0AAV9Z9C5_9AGAR
MLWKPIRHITPQCHRDHRQLFRSDAENLDFDLRVLFPRRKKVRSGIKGDHESSLPHRRCLSRHIFTFVYNARLKYHFFRRLSILAMTWTLRAITRFSVSPPSSSCSTRRFYTNTDTDTGTSDHLFGHLLDPRHIFPIAPPVSLSAPPSSPSSLYSPALPAFLLNPLFRFSLIRLPTPFVLSVAVPCALSRLSLVIKYYA